MDAREARLLAREDVAHHAKVLADSCTIDEGDPDTLRMYEAYLWVAAFLGPQAYPQRSKR